MFDQSDRRCAENALERWLGPFGLRATLVSARAIASLARCLSAAKRANLPVTAVEFRS